MTNTVQSTATPTATTAVFPENPTQFSFTLSRDGANQTFSRTIDSPGWHLVRVNVDGLSNQGGANASREFTFLITYNADNLRWGTNRNIQNNACNTSVRQFFTVDSNLLTLYLRVESGSSVTYTIFANP